MGSGAGLPFAEGVARGTAAAASPAHMPKPKPKTASATNPRRVVGTNVRCFMPCGDRPRSRRRKPYPKAKRPSPTQVSVDAFRRFSKTRASLHCPCAVSVVVVLSIDRHDVEEQQQLVPRERANLLARAVSALRSARRLPRNRPTGLPGVRPLQRGHIERKVAAFDRYKSQEHRRYSHREHIWNVSGTHGINVSREYAEVFTVDSVVA